MSFIKKKSALRPRRAGPLFSGGRVRALRSVRGGEGHQAVASALEWGRASCRVWLSPRAPGGPSGSEQLSLWAFSLCPAWARPSGTPPQQLTFAACATPGLSFRPPPRRGSRGLPRRPTSPRHGVTAPGGGLGRADPLVCVGSEPLPSTVTPPAVASHTAGRRRVAPVASDVRAGGSFPSRRPNRPSMETGPALAAGRLRKHCRLRDRTHRLWASVLKSKRVFL